MRQFRQFLEYFRVNTRTIHIAVIVAFLSVMIYYFIDLVLAPYLYSYELKDRFTSFYANKSVVDIYNMSNLSKFMIVEPSFLEENQAFLYVACKNLIREDLDFYSKFLDDETVEKIGLDLCFQVLYQAMEDYVEANEYDIQKLVGEDPHNLSPKFKRLLGLCFMDNYDEVIRRLDIEGLFVCALERYKIQ